MSYDIFVQDLPPGIESIDDIPDDFEPSPIGDRTEIVDTIRRLCPEGDFSDPAWVRIDGEGYAIEVNLGSEERLDGFAFHVRGGEAALYVIKDLLDGLGLRALDPASDRGIFSLGGDSMDGYRRWQEFRRRGLGA